MSLPPLPPSSDLSTVRTRKDPIIDRTTDSYVSTSTECMDAWPMDSYFPLPSLSVSVSESDGSVGRTGREKERKEKGEILKGMEMGSIGGTQNGMGSVLIGPRKSVGFQPKVGMGMEGVGGKMGGNVMNGSPSVLQAQLLRQGAKTREEFKNIKIEVVNKLPQSEITAFNSEPIAEGSVTAIAIQPYSPVVKAVSKSPIMQSLQSTGYSSPSFSLSGPSAGNGIVSVSLQAYSSMVLPVMRPRASSEQFCEKVTLQNYSPRSPQSYAPYAEGVAPAFPKSASVQNFPSIASEISILPKACGFSLIFFI